MPKDFAPWEDPQYGQGTGSKEVAPWEDASAPEIKQEKKKDPMGELDDLSVPRQVLSGALGGPEAVLSMASGIPAMVWGGAKGAKALITGKGGEAAAEAARQGTSDLTYEPRTAAGKVFTDLAGKGFDALKEGTGEAAVQLDKYNPISAGARAGSQLMSGNKVQPFDISPQEEAAVRTGGEAALEFGAAAGPLAELHGRVAPERPKVTTELPKREVAPWDMPADLFDKDPHAEYNQTPIDNPQQMVRGAQYGQMGDLEGRQAAYDAEQAQFAREEAARQGQPDMFQTPQEDLQNRTEQGGTGMRDTVPGSDLEARGVREGEFHPELTDREYSGPREQGELFDNSMDFKKYDPDRVNDQVAASEIPGFLRSAEEVMRARELERAEKPQNQGVTTVTTEKPQNEGFQDARLSDNNFAEFNDPKLAQKMEKYPLMREGGKNAVRVGLEHIRDNSTAPYYRELATKLLGDADFKPNFRLVDQFPGGDRAAGRYYSSTHGIAMLKRFAGSEQLLLHEAIHARTFSALEAFKNKEFAPGTWKKFEHLEVPVKQIFDLFKSLEDRHLFEENGWNPGHPLREVGNSYGLTDVHEFVAEGFSNPAFQAKLAQLKVPREVSGKGAFKYYWDAFVGRVAELMGLKGARANTYLSELLHSGSELMSGMGKNERIYYADLLDEHMELGARVEDLGIVGAMQDAAREFRLDKFEKLEKEIIPELTKPDAKIEDFTAKDSNLLWQSMLRLGSLVKKNLLQDTTLAQLMQDKPGTGPVVRWTIDQVSRIEREGITKTKSALDTALKPFRRMYHDKALRPDLMEAWKTWQQNIGVRDLTRADFKTDRQWEVYRNFQAVFDTILDEINVKRAAAGFKQIDKISSYFHAAWEGDYRVFAYDGAGNKVWAQGFKNEFEAKKWAKAYREKHPELRIDDPSHVVRDKYGLNDLSSFEDAIRVMSDKDSKVTRALQETYREILQKRGFGRTAVHRKGVLGFMGMEEGALGLRMMEKSFDQYVNQAYRYMGNLDKQKVLSELQKVPTEIRKEKLPETFDFLYSYIRKTQGAAIDTMAVDRFVEQISQAVGLGAGAPLRFIRSGGQIASLYWLTTPRFLASQAVQSINAIPKLIQQFGTVNGTKAFFDGWLHTLKPDALTKEGAEWAAKRGYLDPTIKNMVTGDPYSVPIGGKYSVNIAGKSIPLGLQAIKEVSSFPAALIEHHLVRLPTFIMFEKALRPFIKDNEKRFQEAAEKTDYYMVNYARAHSPLVYDKLGLLGEAARPLKQYSHNTWGQFIEYSKGLKDKGEVAPLAAFFGTQAAVAGLKGTMLVAEATVIINTLNNMFDMDIPTPEQLMLKSGLHDALVYGGLSSVLGFDVSSSVAAPSLPQMFSFPALQFGVKSFIDVGNYALKLAKGVETDQDRLKAAMAVSPNLMHEWLRSLYTKPGEPTVNPNDPQLRGNYRRSESENNAAIVFGAKPLEEAKADALMRAVKQELQRDIQSRMDALDAMADRVINGKEVTPELLQKYIQEGGDIKRLPSNLINRMRNRSMTGPERLENNKTLTPSTIHKLDIERQYLDRITNDSKNKAMGYDPDTGELKPISETQYFGVGGKRVYSDSNPPTTEMRIGRYDADKGMSTKPFKDQENEGRYVGRTSRMIHNEIRRPDRIRM